MAFSVTIKPIDEVITVEEGQTILDAALRAGLHLPYACGRGLCSTCKVEVLEGDVDIGDPSSFALLDIERTEGKCLTCCARPLSDMLIEADIDADPDAECSSVADYRGMVTKLEDLSPQVKGIFLALPGSGMTFQAGQYININIPGLPGAPRAFSIANPPSARNLVELNIALVDGGEATHYLHNHVKVGDTLSFSGPFGSFYIRKSMPGPVLLIATGSGLSSLKSMIMELLESGDSRAITLIYGARKKEELYYRKLFEQLAKNSSNFTYLPLLCPQSDGLGWDGHYEYIQAAVRQQLNGNSEHYNAYICGPPPLIDACVTTLIQGRCFEDHIFMENFYNNTNKHNELRSPLFKKV